eukprot:TRINITY_DN26838_c0_g1_i1.p1 TRINITY_DN26838_c0_g1~~TRINITY_DN26838_c0_g1_i1.p1  ORF type:complete len:577 (-),score=110.78 TRINITY_DN26838_c0_g1_i1:29-1759(-)
MLGRRLLASAAWSFDAEHGDEDGLKVPAAAFWIVCLTVFIDSLGGSISAPVLPFYAQEFHASSYEVGLLFSSFSIAQVVFLPVFGSLADRVGRRWILVLSLFGAACGAFSQALAGSFTTLVISRVISGACGAVGSTANVYVSDITSEGVRGQYLGYLMSSNGAAFAFGPGLGGGLSHFGLNVPIAANGALCVFSGLLAFAYLPESPAFGIQKLEAPVAPSDAAAQVAATRACRRRQAAIWAVFIAEFLRGFSFSAIFAMYGLFALHVYNLDSLRIGYTVCVGAISLICTNVWLTAPLQRGVGLTSAATLGVWVMALGELTLAYAPTLQFSLLGMWSVYVGQAIAGATIAALTSQLATDECRGQVMSMQQMAQALGRVVGPILLGRLSDMDPRLPFAAASVACALAGLFLCTVRLKAEPVPDGSPVVGPSSTTLRSVQEFNESDVEELGRFLCELLTNGGYNWREQEQREALKKTLQICFPRLDSDDPRRADIRTVLDDRRGHTRRGGLGVGNLHGASLLGSGFEAVGVDGFLSSPAPRLRAASKENPDALRSRGGSLLGSPSDYLSYGSRRNVESS